VKRIFSVLWIAVVLLGSRGLSGAIVDRVAAVVNQEIIMLSEVEKMMEVIGEEIRAGDRLERLEHAREVRQKVLNQLIDEKLVDLEIKRLGLKASNKELDGALEDIRTRNNVTEEQMIKLLEKDGLTLEAFKKQIEKRILRNKVLQWSVKVESTPGEQELREFYRKNAERYRSQEIYRTAHILLRVPSEATPEQVQQIRLKCSKILERIRGGEDFGEIAIVYSEDISAKDRGDLGYFKLGELLPAFEKEALRLRVGEVGGIVRTPYGFHIVKLLDRKGGTPLPFEEVQERIRADYAGYQLEAALNRYLSSLRQKSIIEIRF
jgi:peptidyl-prolyl cis-trans isomerase SurA